MTGPGNEVPTDCVPVREERTTFPRRRLDRNAEGRNLRGVSVNRTSRTLRGKGCPVSGSGSRLVCVGGVHTRESSRGRVETPETGTAEDGDGSDVSTTVPVGGTWTVRETGRQDRRTFRWEQDVKDYLSLRLVWRAGGL